MTRVLLGCAVPQQHLKYMDSAFKAAWRTVLQAQKSKPNPNPSGLVFSALPRGIVPIICAQLAQMWVRGPTGVNRAEVQRVAATEGLPAGIELLERQIELHDDIVHEEQKVPNGDGSVDS
eukprot:TRINITY_DN53480_c0_g1_i1.p1 TRINITY_DN53480_c0_g1~~TRINITY_DN53480_c0_g1_i1.p1  ORF type:complete len:120 (-),score=16.73 TRINITY_DN53480_c0_g1_i1:21-380(-)